MLPESVQTFIDAEIAANATDYSDLKAVFLNGTLKRSPEVSHTEGLIEISRHIMTGVGVRTDLVRAVDHVIPPGVFADMREHGWPTDDFPDLYHSVIEPADIVVLATPIWLGDQASMTRLLIERLYGWSDDLNAAGQWSYYGKVGGVLVTGNEDGGKHCAAQMMYAMSHIGFTIPPQADSYWNGEAGPGPSYLDDNRGAHNHWTTRNTVFAAWNMLHTARRLKDTAGIPAHGNVPPTGTSTIPTTPTPNTAARRPLGTGRLLARFAEGSVQVSGLPTAPPSSRSERTCRSASRLLSQAGQALSRLQTPFQVT